MNKKLFTAFVIVLLTASIVSVDLLQAKRKESIRAKVAQLDKKYRDWLDLVGYIITPTEKNVFFKLKNNRERDSFMAMFWNLRDPSKGTPENEYKEEHLKRFAYADRYFGFGSPIPGWKTDRGRIWILLGPPVHRNEISNYNELYPVEIWEYYGGVKKGLPPVFRMVFYKKSGAGDFRLYIPSVDGPAALLRSEIGSIDPHNYRQVYKAIHDVEPQVAEVALTLIPGESTVNYSPSLQAPILVAKIYELPVKRINASYARNFLNYKGLVETSVVTNYINIRSDIYVLRDPILKLNFIHFALLPERISVDYLPEKDRYYFNFDLLVFLKKGEDTVFQYTKKYPFYYTREDLENKISHGIIITDYFPVIDGDFKFIAILQNSFNKEMSYFEKRIIVGNRAAAPAAPGVFGPLISYQVIRDFRPVYAAFNIVDTNIKIDPKKAFGQQDTLYSFFSVDRGGFKQLFRVLLDVLSVDQGREYNKTYTFEFPAAEQFRSYTQPLEKLAYGNYALKVRLLDESGKELAVRENPFQVSPMSSVPHPPLVSKTLKKEHHFMFHMLLARQYQNLEDLSTAELYYESAFKLNSSFPQLLKSYAALLFKTKKYQKILQVIKNLETREKEKFDYYSLKGRALYYLGKYKEAVDALLEANKIYDSDMAVLNALGLSLVRIGNEEEAVKVFSASLKINDEQPDIARLLKQMQKKPKNKKKGE